MRRCNGTLQKQVRTDSGELKLAQTLAIRTAHLRGEFFTKLNFAVLAHRAVHGRS
jgi:hypothetical protein